MPDFQSLFDEVLKQKSDIDKIHLQRLVEEKKDKVGAGYLTDQGAIFLVASDLGVSLDHMASSDLMLKDLYIGANEITVAGRAFAIYPSRTYTRKDGSEGQYRRLVLYDSETFVKVTLWDEKGELIEDLKIGAETNLRIVKGYVKSGLDGNPVLSLGKRGRIELISEQNFPHKIPRLGDIAKDVSEIRAPHPFLVVKGVLCAEPSLSHFTRRDGRKGSVLQLYVSGSEGRQIRVAVWDVIQEDAAQININSTIIMSNLRSKVLSRGEIELHGDESTIIKVLSEGSPEVTVGRRSDTGPKKRFRLLAKGSLVDTGIDGPSTTLIVTDEHSQFYTVLIIGDAVEAVKEIGVDSMVICDGKHVGGTTIVCKDISSIDSSSGGEESFPRLSDLLCMLGNVKANSTPVFAEVIALSKTEEQDISIEDGSTVKMAEVLVGDSTAEAKLTAWRELTAVIKDVLPGQRLRLMRVIAQRGLGQSISLEVKSYSLIEKL